MQLRGKNVSNTCCKGVSECLFFSPMSLVHLLCDILGRYY